MKQAYNFITRKTRDSQTTPKARRHLSFIQNATKRPEIVHRLKQVF